MSTDCIGMPGLPPATADFYRDAMAVLRGNDLPFLVAGAYALSCYTGIERHTKDFDVFIKEEDLDDILEAMEDAGYDTVVTDRVWLAKVWNGENFVDLIFNSGNGVCKVDDTWFERARTQKVLGVEVQLCPPEPIIWQKAFIMARDRFDGADVAHLLLCCSDEIDWDLLLDMFEPHWRILLSHLVLFDFIYPDARDRIPAGVIDELLQRAQQDRAEENNDPALCQGTLLARTQYLHDLDTWGYTDGRTQGPAGLTRKEARHLSKRTKRERANKKKGQDATKPSDDAERQPGDDDKKGERGAA